MTPGGVYRSFCRLGFPGRSRVHIVFTGNPPKPHPYAYRTPFPYAYRTPLPLRVPDPLSYAYRTPLWGKFLKKGSK